MRNYKQYSKFYSEESFWKKLKGFAGKAGIQVVYLALVLYYMLIDEVVDLKSKMTIVAALGYFILPIDLVPDILPVIGFTDDLSFLMLAFSTVKMKINETHRLKARITMVRWFGNIDAERLLGIESDNCK